MTKGTFTFFVGPSVFIMLALMTLPLLASVVLGLHYITFRNLDAPIWIGFQNYQEVLADPEFWDSLEFTLLFIAATVPLRIALGLMFALLLDQVRRFRGVFIAAALVPFVMTPVVGTLIFRDMFDRGGPYWYWMQQLFDYRLFMNSTTVPLLIIFHSIWTATPFAHDCACSPACRRCRRNRWRRPASMAPAGLRQLWHVAIPHLRSLFIFIALISIMDAYRVFDSVFVLTQQNPIYDAETIMYYNFQVAMSFGRLGKANAMSVLTVIGIFVVLIPFLAMTYREQTEEELMTRTDNPYRSVPHLHRAGAVHRIQRSALRLDDHEFHQAAEGRQRQNRRASLFSPNGRELRGTLAEYDAGRTSRPMAWRLI